PHCLRFAGWVAPPPRKTRFWLLVQLCQAGFVPAGFQRKVSEFKSLPPSQSLPDARTPYLIFGVTYGVPGTTAGPPALCVHDHLSLLTLQARRKLRASRSHRRDRHAAGGFSRVVGGFSCVDGGFSRVVGGFSRRVGVREAAHCDRLGQSEAGLDERVVRPLPEEEDVRRQADGVHAGEVDGRVASGGGLEGQGAGGIPEVDVQERVRVQGAGVAASAEGVRAWGDELVGAG